jgi:hypothetical protein
MKLKLINKTHYRTTDLRSLVLAALHREAPGHKTWYVRVTYRRAGTERRGCAYLRSTSFRLMVERSDGGDMSDFDRDTLAYVIVHEIAHCRGMTHAQMRATAFEGHARDCAWASAFRVRARPVVPPLTAAERRAARVADAAARAEKKVEEWSRRAKLAATKLRKWKRRLDTAKRKAAAFDAAVGSQVML